MIATPEQRRARDARLGPLLDRKERLTKDRAALEAATGPDRHPGAEERRRLDEVRRELAALAEEVGDVPPLPKAWAGTFAQPAGPAYLMLGGDPDLGLNTAIVVTAPSLESGIHAAFLLDGALAVCGLAVSVLFVGGRIDREQLHVLIHRHRAHG